MIVSSALTRLQMSQGLSSLATISSGAALLGFLTTCLGIMSTVEGAFMGQRGVLEAAVMRGTAEAIVPTSLGLAVAILSWWGYRFLTVWVDEFELEMHVAAEDLLKQLKPRLIVPQ